MRRNPSTRGTDQAQWNRLILAVNACLCLDDFEPRMTDEGMDFSVKNWNLALLTGIDDYYLRPMARTRWTVNSGTPRRGSRGD
jgi:hypothetical protein